MNATETRILRLPSLSSKHAIVSMPRTAWYWLDDLVKTEFPKGGYKALIKAFEKADCATTLSSALRGKAQEHCDAQMAAIYALANDNTPSVKPADLKRNPALPANPDLSSRMPLAYQLFKFLPQATYLTTVWERRNYQPFGREPS